MLHLHMVKYYFGVLEEGLTSSKMPFAKGFSILSFGT